MKTYSAKRVVICPAGIPLTGMGPDAFLSIKRKTPEFSSEVGADGTVVRSQSADRRVDIEITLLAASPSNGVLQTLYTVDAESGSAPFPLTAQDLNGRFVATINKAWIVGAPDIEAGKTDGNVTWKLEGESAVSELGGSLV